jgi:hypothetical protein
MLEAITAQNLRRFLINNTRYTISSPSTPLSISQAKTEWQSGQFRQQRILLKIIFKNAGLPLEFWDKAAATDAYLKNRTDTGLLINR